MFPVVDVSDTSMAASGTTKRISANNILSSSPTASGALTVTGLVTAGSATITGAATVGTTLGVTGTSTLASANVSGLLGVGTVSPDASFKATLSGLYGLRVQSADTNNSAINFGSDTSAGYSFIDTTKTGSGSFLPLRFSTSDTERIRISTAGDVSISTGNVVMATSGKGIDFSATASGSGTMTSELLNDYEEGTWVGTLTGNGGTNNPTIPVTATGRYTKIGRVVTVQISFINVITTGASGYVGITGLPFAINASVASVGEISLYSLATFTGSPFALLSTNDSFLTFYANVSGAAFSDVNHSAGTGRFSTVSITYTVA
jgi:hypothetical protein